MSWLSRTPAWSKVPLSWWGVAAVALFVVVTVLWWILGPE
jgi:hypothetical protein